MSPRTHRLAPVVTVSMGAALWLAFTCATTGAVAEAQQIKGRALVLVDTSGSMIAHFNNNNGCGGDGDAASRYTDRLVANRNWYPGTIVGGQPDGRNSRMYAAKQALTNVLNATGDVDFGLMRYAPAPVPVGCQNSNHCCNFATPQCIRNGNYIDNGGLMNWNGDCGPITNNIATDGGQILVLPSGTSNSTVLPWVDNVENFQDNGQGNPINPELRCAGPTPLAGSARTALNKWYLPIYNVSKQGLMTYNPNSPLFDAQIDCRPYVTVLMTDGADTCDGNPNTAPPAAVKALYDANAANHPLTYVIGLAFQQGDPAITVLNNMATEGHTGTARFANDQAAIEAALADMVAASVKVEVCNNKDDNCNAVVDEGFDKGAVCNTGVGACAKAGIKKCDPNNNTQVTCCVNDGLPNGACVPLVAGMPVKETCNGIDDDCNGIIDDPPVCQQQGCVPETCNGKDDDCDGIIDNKLIDVGKVCGINLGQCKPGTTVCLNGMNQDVTMMGVVPGAMDHLVCQGGVQPAPEVCDGLDNDCDGVVDGISRACYSGPMGTDGVGACVAGTQKCTAVLNSGMAMWGVCVGELLPSKELCNGVDDDCNGKIDDPPGFGQACCPSGKCGVGVCTAGTMQCSGGALACVGGMGPHMEVCNNVDDDCNGKVDDLGNIGQACVAPNGCPGTLTCDVMKMTQVCTPSQMNCNPGGPCMGDPRLGTPCGKGIGLPAPCAPGTWVCENNAVICKGGKEPGAETCNCLDDDCNGKTDDGAFCPGGTACLACECLGPCGDGEFPCDGGFTCVSTPCAMDSDCPGTWKPTCDPIKKVCVHGYCAPNNKCNPPCVLPEMCVVDKCVDPCKGKTCKDGEVCRAGNCEDNTCRTLDNCKKCDGAGGGERCDLMASPPKCVPDLCCGKSCDADKICDAKTGECAPTCRNVKCAQSEVCVDGVCKPACAKQCMANEWCDPRFGDCAPLVGSSCSGVRCPTGQTCCMGGCNLDPCDKVPCGPGFRCSALADCSAVCTPIPYASQDNVVGAGGGGFSFGCSVGATRDGSGGGGLLLFGLTAVVIALGRRRNRLEVA